MASVKEQIETNYGERQAHESSLGEQKLPRQILTEERFRKWMAENRVGWRLIGRTVGSKDKFDVIPPCGHTWSATISNIKSFGCAICSGKKIALENCLATTSPHLMKEWHATKNQITPYEITKSSPRKVWWFCKKCTEVWLDSPNHRTNRGSGCPYCSCNRLGRFNNLQARFPELAKEWHPTKNGKLKPDEVFPGTLKKVWWRYQCGHEGFQRIHGRAMSKKGCHLCGGSFPKTQEEYCEEVQELYRGAIKVVERYVNDSTKILHECAIDQTHGQWLAKPSAILQNAVLCKKCNNLGHASKIERAWLDSLGIPDDDFHRQVPIKIGGRRFNFDGFDPKTKTVYEFLGDFWHGNPAKFDLDAFNRATKCKFGELLEKTMKKLRILRESGFTVIYIWEADFRDAISKKRGL